MKQLDGWYCPDACMNTEKHARQAQQTLEVLLRATSCRGTVIQAGGHVGAYPRALSTEFAQVYTFEPDADNFAALVRNVEGIANLYPARGGLGARPVPLSFKPGSHGTTRHGLCLSPGPIPVYRVDDLNLQDVDAILLDVEGMEIQAIYGAELTIARCRPIVIAEENRCCEFYGYKQGDLKRLMGDFGYVVAGRVGADFIFVPYANL